MSVRSVVTRQRAEQDIDDAIDFYASEGGADLALSFIDELEAAFSQLAAQPHSGSLRYSSELDIPQLRYWTLRRFPHLIFYVFTPEIVDVWRVIHGARDIPQWMREPAE